MRSRRLLTVVGLSIGACALTAPAASACILESASAMPVSGSGTVRPGELVRITINTIATAESPGPSPYVIKANDHEIGRGTALPDTNVVNLPLDALGTSSGRVLIVVTLMDSPDQPLTVPYTLMYDGRPAAAQPQAPETVQAPAPVTQQTPAPAAKPVSAPAAGPRTKSARPEVVSRPAPRVHATPRSTAPATRAPRASHVQALAVPQRRPLEPAPAVQNAAPMKRPAARMSQPVSRPRVDRASPLATRIVSRRVAADAGAVPPRSQPTATAAAPDRTGLVLTVGALLLALFAGGAGLAVAAIRRRGPLEPEAPDRLAEIEAELQEMLAEERLRAEAEAGAPPTPVAP